MSDNGLFVYCDREAPKRKDHPIQISRVICFFHKFRGCKRCEHKEFTILFQVRIGNQEVECPRWGKKLSDKDDPKEYVTIRREMCLRAHKVFQFCYECPNSQGSSPPQSEKGWVTGWRKNKKKIRKRIKSLMEKLDEVDSSSS